MAEGPPHERLHKPLLLLPVFDLLDEDLAALGRVPWSQSVRDRFAWQPNESASLKLNCNFNVHLQVEH